MERRNAEDRKVEEFPIGVTPFSSRLPELVYQLARSSFTAQITKTGQSIQVRAGTYENCIIVRIREKDESDYDEYTFAPNIGEIRYFSSRGQEHELISYTPPDPS